MPTHRTTDRIDQRLKDWLVTETGNEYDAFSLNFKDALDLLLKKVGF